MVFPFGLPYRPICFFYSHTHLPKTWSISHLQRNQFLQQDIAVIHICNTIQEDSKGTDERRSIAGGNQHISFESFGVDKFCNFLHTVNSFCKVSEYPYSVGCSPASILAFMSFSYFISRMLIRTVPPSDVLPSPAVPPEAPGLSTFGSCLHRGSLPEFTHYPI